MIPTSDNAPATNPAEQNPRDAEDLWKTSHVAKFLYVSSRTVLELRKRGLPYLKLGGAVRFIPDEVRQYLHNSRVLTAHRLRQIARKGGAA